MKNNLKLKKIIVVFCGLLLLSLLANAQTKTSNASKSKTQKAHAKAAGHWVKLVPVSYTAVEEIFTKNKISTSYYEATKSKPVKIEINGPKKIKVLLRLGFNCKMKGKIDYRVTIREDNNIKNTYQISAQNSTQSVFKNIKDLTPGMANFIYIDVPSGAHSYEIYPVGHNSPRLFCRILKYENKPVKKKTTVKKNNVQ